MLGVAWSPFEVPVSPWIRVPSPACLPTYLPACFVCVLRLSGIFFVPPSPQGFDMDIDW